MECGAGPAAGEIRLAIGSVLQEMIDQDLELPQVPEDVGHPGNVPGGGFVRKTHAVGLTPG